jgi:hypothetical protein
MIDYMLVIFYGGNLDAPISNFLGNTSPNNWFGLRNRFGADGFRFYSHDAEHTLLNVNENRTGPYSAGDSSVTKSSPQWIFQKCMANPEFRMRVADRVQQYCFNGGVLTPEGATATFLRRKAEIDQAVIAESARWGDSKRTTPLTRDDWVNTVNGIVNNYFSQRTTVLLNQLRAKNLFPSLSAPTVSPFGGSVEEHSLLTLYASSGTIYYTLDGTDPRLRGGGVAPGANTYSKGLEIVESVTVKARALSGTNWSALVEAPFTVIQTYSNLWITEIMYHPASEGATDPDRIEFLELKNGEDVEIDLSGVRITNAVNFTFPQGMHLAPGELVLLVNNSTNFVQRYPGVNVGGVYRGNLANGGERITIVHAAGAVIADVAYGDDAPWPVAADGQGFSLVPVDVNLRGNSGEPSHWRSSTRTGGSPGADDPFPSLNGYAIINEVLTHTDPPAVDSIELFNPGALEVDLGGWFLTDSRSTPKKYRVPEGTKLGSGGYMVLDERQFNSTPGSGSSFTLNSHGDDVYLYSADLTGNLTGFSDGFHFEAAANGVSFGRYTNSSGIIQYPPQRDTSLGTPNLGPRVGAVIINEIHYAPATGEAEFVELKNTSDQAVPLFDPSFPTNTWRVGGTGFQFPTNVFLGPGGLLVIAGGDPAAFRARFSIPDSVFVFGPMSGNLQDDGERVALQRPDAPDIETNGAVVVAMITVDEVKYSSRPPWPAQAAGQGFSLERIDPRAWGNDPANWKVSAGVPSPGLENDGNRPPAVSAGLAQQVLAASFPALITLEGAAADDGLPATPGFLHCSWRQVSGPGRALILTSDQNKTQVQLPGLGSYVFEFTASDSELSKSAQVAVSAGRPPAESSLILAGSRWKFWDKGSEPQGGWTTLNYDETGWGSGPGPLGYGDGDEATPVSFGADGNNKFMTTYFRTRMMMTNAASAISLKLGVQHDDGVVVYINGIEVYRDNLPEGTIIFDSRANTAIGGEDENTYFEKEVDPAVLVEGANIVAVEIHQSSPSSSDIGFDLTAQAQVLTGSQPLIVSAGLDQKIALTGFAQLEGSFLDDGLPLPPGVVTVQWSKISGPGTVEFGDAGLWRTRAALAEPGAYVLRLTATDGAIEVQDEVQIEVESASLQPAQWEAIEPVPGLAPKIKLVFKAVAHQRYAIEFCDAFGGTGWKLFEEVPAQEISAAIEVYDALDVAQPSRFYRVVSLAGGP